MASAYYYTKEGPDEWTVHGRRHHLIIERFEGPTGRVDRRDNDILGFFYFIRPPGGFGRVDPIMGRVEMWTGGWEHGFIRLRDAVKFAVEELVAYDDRVDPR
jgi:hypothetical protein